jgi:type II secretory pathway pseudopilin PulG
VTRNERGFSLIEALISMLVMTVGLVGMAQLMAVTTVGHSDAREASMGTELAQAKLDELSGMNLATDAAVQITPPSPDSLDQNVADYFDQPAGGITRRWKVEAGPSTGTRIVTLRVINTASRQYGDSIYFRTMLRQW